MKKALVTGIAGFAGSHLAELLLKKGITVFGFYHPNHPTENIQNIESKITLNSADLLNKPKIEAEIAKINPDYVFHLAAFSSPAQSFKNPEETLRNNIFGELYLLEALSKIKSKANILVIGSAEEYGELKKNELPATEKTLLSPLTPYAVSKVAQDLLGYQFFLHENLNIVRVRPFNHIGPRQSTSFVVSAFASQIAKLEKQGGGVMKVGNLESSRDFTDVRDMVKAYFLAVTKGKMGEVYNVGSGKLTKISDVLQMMLSLTKTKIKVESEKSRLHEVDVKAIYCNFGKFHKQTNWMPTTPMSQTLSDTIDYERGRLS